VPDDELISLRRAGDIAEARQFVYYILWRSGVSLSHIGRVLGRHHSSVIHGIQKTKERLATEDGRYAYTCILACMYDQSWRVAS
jgi:chromosomal replication initiation ATPase DnaA